MAPLTTPLVDDGGVLAIAESCPANGATDVPVDAHLTLRFSHGVRPETRSEQTGAKS